MEKEEENRQGESGPGWKGEEERWRNSKQGKTGFEVWPGWPFQIAISGVEEGGEKENGKVQAGER